VDALSTLLMVIIFVLLVFVLAQGFLSVALSSRDRALDRLNRQVAELAELLALERGQAEELRGGLARATAELTPPRPRAMPRCARSACCGRNATASPPSATRRAASGAPCGTPRRYRPRHAGRRRNAWPRSNGNWPRRWRAPRRPAAMPRAPRAT
jgi:hypothetical protein